MSHPLPQKTLSLKNRVRFVTATSLFDGHDAAINIMRRILQSMGAEVIHLGHDRGVEEIVEVAIQEDVQGIAVSSYQGGHNEFFRYMIDLLRQNNAEHIRVFGGGGGVIIPREIKELMDYGVCRIYSPEDGREMGLEGMIADMLKKSDFSLTDGEQTPDPNHFDPRNSSELARMLTWVEQNEDANQVSTFLDGLPKSSTTPVIGLTGTGGAGKSCLTDELVRRFIEEFPERRVAVVSVDPSKRKTGGALLGDRMRMNAIQHPNVFMRSLATRRSHLATSESLLPILHLLKASSFDLILVETAGIGQSDTEITDLADLSVYVMTPEYGASTQLEKIDMIDYADCIVINKFDKPGAEDALDAVRKQYRRSHLKFDDPVESLPVFGIVANRFNDKGTNWFYFRLLELLKEKELVDWTRKSSVSHSVSQTHELIPASRKHYLRQISETVRAYKAEVQKNSENARDLDQLRGTISQLCGNDEALREQTRHALSPISEAGITPEALPVVRLFNKKLATLPPTVLKQIEDFSGKRELYLKESFQYQVRQKTIEVENRIKSLSGLMIPKVAVPRFEDLGEITKWLGLENFPGEFPYTAGIFPFKREQEDPTRMFAGEGIAEKTNLRFHMLAEGQPATRLSTAFDSVTLYGSDPHPRPDIFGKVGNAGVSVCTVDDAKRLYSGFDLCTANTSVSMTINGPAPTVLAFFLNAAVDQQVEKHLRENGKLDEVRNNLQKRYAQQDLKLPGYRMELPKTHQGLGLGLLGISGSEAVDAEIYHNIREHTLTSVRGTVQADILKEDQAQNTCIFSTEFALRMMGDIQEFFTGNGVRNFYSVSISGYHIAEAGANPITQVAFTLANGFTIIEYYLARGLSIDSFARNLSYFFSNGMDPEYAVIGRVARRIFAVALRDLYQASEGSCKLKYHIQTSGRSLHAMEIDFNDIRTTLQALYAVYDNCNSLHTNAYDEAITTPTEESVRRALAIQLIINHELGQAYNQNPLQGSFVIEELTHLVEEAILSEFIRLSDRGGVLGAMETMYQRNKIQEESLHYETLKHTGEMPIMGVNTFLNPQPPEETEEIQLARSTDDEKYMQINDLELFHRFHQAEREPALKKLRNAVLNDENTFEALMDCAKVCSLGQVTQELYRLGGQYRRNM